MAKKNTSLGCLFWFAVVLLILVVFLFNQKNIERVVRNTGFIDIFKHKTAPLNIKFNIFDDKHGQTEVSPPSEEQPPAQKITVESEPAPQPVKPAQVEQEPKLNLRKAKLYYVKVNDDESISLVSVVRKIYYQDSPLRETLDALLLSLSAEEINKGLINMIPQNTKLISVYVKGNTAFLDFSGEFMFNQLGSNGLTAQLKQIVYTATEFSNIYNVQILIDGQKKDYLNSEGLYVGAPLSKESFSS